MANIKVFSVLLALPRILSTVICAGFVYCNCAGGSTHGTHGIDSCAFRYKGWCTATTMTSTSIKLKDS